MYSIYKSTKFRGIDALRIVEPDKVHYTSHQIIDTYGLIPYIILFDDECRHPVSIHPVHPQHYKIKISELEPFILMETGNEPFDLLLTREFIDTSKPYYNAISFGDVIDGLSDFTYADSIDDFARSDGYRVSFGNFNETPDTNIFPKKGSFVNESTALRATKLPLYVERVYGAFEALIIDSNGKPVGSHIRYPMG